MFMKITEVDVVNGMQIIKLTDNTRWARKSECGPGPHVGQSVLVAAEPYTLVALLYGDDERPLNERGFYPAGVAIPRA